MWSRRTFGSTLSIPLRRPSKHISMVFIMGKDRSGEKMWLLIYDDINFIMPLRQAYDALKDYAENEYVDYHRWIFTQNSFVLTVKELHYLDLIHVDVERIQSDSKRCDFFVCMKKKHEQPDEETWAVNRLQYYKNVNRDLLEQLIHSDIMEENDLNADLIRENADLEIELSRIYNSRAWKFVNFLKQIRIRLMPDNSLLHRWFVRLAK